MKVLKQRALKGQETINASHWQLALEQIQCKVSGAYKDFFQIKVQKDLHENWLCQLIAAQTEVKNTTKAHLWKQTMGGSKKNSQTGQKSTWPEPVLQGSGASRCTSSHQ